MRSSVKVESQAKGAHASDHHEADKITTKREKKRDQKVRKAQTNDNKKGFNTNVRP